MPAPFTDIDYTGAGSAASSATATTANVAGSATVVTLSVANPNREGFAVSNDSGSAMYLKEGAAASATSFTVKVPAGGYWEMPLPPVYTGIITALWDTATGFARTTELSG